MFHVYVEGPTGTGAAAARALADAMASRYGLSAQDLLSRFARGRIRVKANVDRRTADTYARDLEAIGARVKVEEARPTDSSAIRRDEIALPTPPTGTRVAPSTTPPAGERSPGSPEIWRETPFARPATPTSGARTPSPQRSFGPGGRRPSSSPIGTEPGTRGRPSSGLPRAALPSRGDSEPMPRASSSRRDSEPIPRAASPTAGSRFPSESRTPSPQRVSESRTPSPQRGTAPTTPPLGTDPGVPTPNPPMRTSPAIVVRPSSPALPARPQSNSLPPSAAAKPAPPTGLAAAFSTTNQPADLGALDELTLSSLDGKDAPDVTIRPATAEFRPPPSAAPAAAPPPPAAKPPPLDLFAPPGAADDNAPLDLMVEDKPKPPPPKPMSIPLAPMPAAPGVLSTPVLRPKVATPAAGIPVAAKPRLPVQALAQPRVRLAAGVVLAILLGFVPAHIVASLREGSAFKAIDAEVQTTQAQATTPEAYGALDSYRDAELDAKYSKRRSIALTSMLIWALASGGLAYVWFRRVPWYRLT